MKDGNFPVGDVISGELGCNRLVSFNQYYYMRYACARVYLCIGVGRRDGASRVQAESCGREAVCLRPGQNRDTCIVICQVCTCAATLAGCGATPRYSLAEDSGLDKKCKLAYSVTILDIPQAFADSESLNAMRIRLSTEERVCVYTK